MLHRTRKKSKSKSKKSINSRLVSSTKKTLSKTLIKKDTKKWLSKTQRSKFMIAIIFILFFEILDAYPEKKAKEIIRRILTKIEQKQKNKKLSNNFDVFIPYIQEKYKVWKEEKNKWDIEISKTLDMEFPIISEMKKKSKMVDFILGVWNQRVTNLLLVQILLIC